MNQRARGSHTPDRTDRDRALAAPESYFNHPREVLALEDCTDEEKIAILLNWQRALIQLQTASEENMLHDEPGRSNVADPLAEVTKALTELGHKGDPAAST
jgi:hypothetical protein